MSENLERSIGIMVGINERFDLTVWKEIIW